MTLLDHLGRLLLFSPEVYAAVFAGYHAASWPLSMLVVAAVAVLRQPSAKVPIAVAALLGVAWAWCGIVFHGYHYASVNWAARGFALLFIIEAVLLGWSAWKLRRATGHVANGWRRKLAMTWVAAVLGWWAVTGAVALWSGVGVHRAGLTPDVVAWLTIGVLPLVARQRTGAMIIPGLWPAVGAVTALLLEDVPSLVMNLAALPVAAVLMLPDPRQAQADGSGASGRRSRR